MYIRYRKINTRMTPKPFINYEYWEADPFCRFWLRIYRFNFVISWSK